MAQRDQDIFETPDPPASVYNYDDDHKSASVMKLEMNMKSSFDKFRNKSLDGGDADFSDSVYRPRQSGFKVQPDDYEVTAVEREPETILQRFQRLKQEVTDLVSDVSRIQEGEKDVEKLLQVSPPDLLQDLQILQGQLNSVQLDRVLGTQFVLSPDHPYQSLLLRDLRAQVKGVKLSGENETVSTQTKQPIYEVYTRTEAAKFAHLSKVSEVEQRLAKLESLVGNSETCVSSVTGGLDSEHKDISSAVMSLQAKVALMDAAHVNTIGAQLQGLVALLDELESKSQSCGKSDDPDTSNKVSEALDMVTRVSTIAPLIPDIVSRLHTLKDLHERASQFAGTVSFMSDSQEKLTNQIAELQFLLSKVQSTFQDNLSTIHSEFTHLESRLSTLQPSKQ